MKRTRPKDDPDPGWAKISWDEAFDMVASRLLEIRKQYGAEAIVFGRATPAGSAASSRYLPLSAISALRPISIRGTIIRPPVIPSPVLIARPALTAVVPVAGKPAIHVRNAADTTIYVQGGSAPTPICSATVGHEPVPLGLNVPTALQVRSWRDVLGMCRCGHRGY